MSLETYNTKKCLHQMGMSMLKEQPLYDAQGNRYQYSKGPEDDPIIPEPEIFTFDATHHSKDNDSAVLPQISECAVHLELLETLFVTRQDILTSTSIDKAMCIAPIREEKTGYKGDTLTLKDTTFWTRRQGKWTKYVECATLRFLAWRSHFNSCSDTSITDTNLPPLDVIMVWHSFLLNPKLFVSHCRDEKLFSVRFPWKCIHRAIDNGKWIYNERSCTKVKYESRFKLPWNLAEHLKSWGGAFGELPFSTANIDTISPRIRMANLSYATVLDQELEEAAAVTYTKLFQKLDQDLCPQLRDAVIRQTKFIDKMNARMWIRSPALSGTLRRAIDRYTKFCELLKTSPSKTMVPTLDIDLVWHTHQCSAKYYGKGMKILCGKFINHDDTIGQETLGDGADMTRQLFRQRFGQEYRICGCWDCEALVSALEDMSSDDQEPSFMTDIVASIKDKVAYYRAVEISRRLGKSLPIQNRKKDSV